MAHKVSAAFVTARKPHDYRSRRAPRNDHISSVAPELVQQDFDDFQKA